jgi:ketosteroid isomerase-like protein
MTNSTRLSAEDRLDIMDLIARYAHTLDTGDLDGYVNNFAPDGVLFVDHHGRDAIRAYVAMLMQQGRAGPLPNGDVAYRHFAGAPTIDGGDGRATVHSYLLWIHMGSDPPISAAAEYLDECVKLDDGRWYFLSRTLRRLAGRFPSSEPVTVPSANT